MKFILLVFTFIALFTVQENFSQNVTNDYSDEDIETALEFLGINFFRIDFSNMKPDNTITIFVDEFSKDSLLSSQRCLFDPGRIKDTDPNEVKIFAKRESYNSDVLWIDIRHPTQYSLKRFDLMEQFRENHFWREFESGDILYQQKIPLLLYGTAWEVKNSNGISLMKFCPDELKKDKSNEAFKLMNHYYVISYKINKK